jgi:hypothetical protein
MHQILASVTKTPEFALEMAEANSLATAIANVARHYDVGATQKTLDWTNLVSTMTVIYGTRIFAARNRLGRERAQSSPEAASHAAGGVVIPIGG